MYARSWVIMSACHAFSAKFFVPRSSVALRRHVLRATPFVRMPVGAIVLRSTRGVTLFD